MVQEPYHYSGGLLRGNNVGSYISISAADIAAIGGNVCYKRNHATNAAKYSYNEANDAWLLHLVFYLVVLFQEITTKSFKC
jgi:hypothetical protein